MRVIWKQTAEGIIWT